MFFQNHENVDEILEIFEIRAAQNCENLVDLGKSCKMTIYLQRSASIQPRTGLRKYNYKVSKILLLLIASPATFGHDAKSPLPGEVRCAALRALRPQSELHLVHRVSGSDTNNQEIRRLI